jgi:hypothetical protein
MWWWFYDGIRTYVLFLTEESAMVAIIGKPIDGLDDGLLRDDIVTVETLTVRQALDAVGLLAPARFYPEWACADAFILVLLLAGGRLPAPAVFRRGAEVGLPEPAVRRAKMRLGIISTRQRCARRNVWFWHLPAELAGEAGLSDLSRRWRRWRDPRTR